MTGSDGTKQRRAVCDRPSRQALRSGDGDPRAVRRQRDVFGARGAVDLADERMIPRVLKRDLPVGEQDRLHRRGRRDRDRHRAARAELAAGAPHARQVDRRSARVAADPLAARCRQESNSRPPQR
jgi:hypothetical protein